MPVFLGIDIGSTTVTAVAVDTASRQLLNVVAVANRAEVTSTADKARGRSEWDFSRIAQTAFGAVRSLVEKAGISSVDGIGITGQQQGCQLFDASSLQAVGSLISWQDRRTTEPGRSGTILDQVAERGAAHLISDGPRGFAASGCPIVPGYTSVILYWLAEQGELRPGLKASTVPEFFVSTITGTMPVTDATDAAGWGVFDVVNGRWNVELLSDLGLDYQLMPGVVASSTVAGSLTAEAAVAMGLPSGIPVSVASGDHQCAFAGSVTELDHSIAINIGTGGQSTVFIPDQSALRRKGDWPDYGSLELRPYIQGGYLLAGVGVVGGRSFRTVRDFFARAGSEVFDHDGDTDAIYSRFVELAADAEPGAGGVEFQPFFTGTRVEPWRRGSITGLTPGNFTPGNVAMALFEGIARQLHAAYVEAQELGAPARDRLIGSGNGVRRNPVLRSSLSRLFGMSLELTARTDETATGAALCAAVATGNFGSIAEASRAFVTY
ncbi:MAG: FGGY family carbohydrate kinase, partial [Chloroflexi bacterium]|nr:FGGY family carbohydrate kinase [Chloroflexota bacterium]